MYDFSGKIAVVTGAAQGLGEAIAKRFLNDGIPGVALLDLNEEVLAATAVRLESGFFCIGCGFFSYAPSHFFGSRQ